MRLPPPASDRTRLGSVVRPASRGAVGLLTSTALTLIGLPTLILAIANRKMAKPATDAGNGEVVV